MFRQLANDQGLSISEQAHILKQQLINPNESLPPRRLDVELDYRTCEIIAGKDVHRYGVIEGRQPAIMGK